jgi:hypothetical protein
MVSIKLMPENSEINVNQKTIVRRISMKQDKISGFVSSYLCENAGGIKMLYVCLAHP